ncbi:MAG TPA: hypothetical protein VGJ29_17540 [Vicinamibacterales bacterium]|jgi:hypothetical protein
MRRLAAAVVAVAALIACSSRPPDQPLKLDGNLLTVDNRSNQNWTKVEIWLNSYYRVTIPSLLSGGRFTVTLDDFVASQGQRFDLRRMPVRDLRLVAKLPDGSPLEIKKDFSANTLVDAFKGVGGKR